MKNWFLKHQAQIGAFLLMFGLAFCGLGYCIGEGIAFTTGEVSPATAQSLASTYFTIGGLCGGIGLAIMIAYSLVSIMRKSE